MRVAAATLAVVLCLIGAAGAQDVAMESVKR